MSGRSQSTYDMRHRAVMAVIEEGLPATVVARAYGTNRITLYRWLVRYEEEGEHGLVRRPVPGRPRKLAELDCKALRAIVLAPTSE